MKEATKSLLKSLREGQDLTSQQIKVFIKILSDSQSSEAELIDLTTAWRQKGESSTELALISQELVSRLMPVESEGIIADCCGTGGDGLQTFNISTTSAIVAASSGLKIAKHGGRQTTSASGSIDFLESLQVTYYTDSIDIQKALQKNNLVFIASPILHQLLGRWKKICRKLGFAGQTGLIGTLSNPIKLTHQIIGVPKLKWGSLMIEALQKIGRANALVIHGEPGLDEASFCGVTHLWHLKNGQITTSKLIPQDFNLDKFTNLENLKGGTPNHNALMFQELLSNSAHPDLINTVCLNSGLLLWLCDQAPDIQAGFKKARHLLETGLVGKYFTAKVQNSAPSGGDN